MSKTVANIIKNNPEYSQYEELLEDIVRQLGKYFNAHPSFFSLFSKEESTSFLALNSSVLEELLKELTPIIALHSTNEKSQKKIQENFIKNIIRLFKRIEKDVELLKNNFLSDMIDPKLINIKSAGSDFHHGGNQVLFLTFKDNPGKEHKVVYKPSFVEADAMLLGNLERLEKIDPLYKGQKSMSEILNQVISAFEPKYPALMPTYLIVPRSDALDINNNNNTTQPTMNYGYIEFIDQGVSPFKPEVHNHLESQQELNKRYKEFLKDSAKNPHCGFILWTEESQKKFSYQAGLTLFMINLISGIDFHSDNIIIADGRIFIIDAENILCPNILPLSTSTGIFSNSNDGGLSLYQCGTTSHGTYYFEKNHAFYFDASNNVLRSYWFHQEMFLKGYEDGLRALADPTEQLLSWFEQEKVKYMHVRFLPVFTDEYYVMMEKCKRHDFSSDFFASLCDEKIKTGINQYSKSVSQYEQILSQDNIAKDYTLSDFEQVISQKCPRLPVPSYIAFSSENNIHNDILNEFSGYCVPYYYMIANRRELFDFNGQPIKITGAAEKMLTHINKNEKASDIESLLSEEKNQPTECTTFFSVAPLQHIYQRAQTIAKDEELRKVMVESVKRQSEHYCHFSPTDTFTLSFSPSTILSSIKKFFS